MRITDTTMGHVAAFAGLLGRDPDLGAMRVRELGVLAVVAAEGRPVARVALAERLGLTPTYIAPIVARMVLAGLVQWDERCITVAATDRGQELNARTRRYYVEACPREEIGAVSPIGGQS